MLVLASGAARNHKRADNISIIVSRGTYGVSANGVCCTEMAI